MRAVAAGLLLATAGCGLLADEGTFRLGDVTVVDEANLVTAATASTGTERISGLTPRVEAGESLTELDVLWMGPDCVDAWTVRIAGNALLVTIEPAEGELDCGMPRVAHVVRLTLNRVIDAGDVDVSLQQVT